MLILLLACAAACAHGAATVEHAAPPPRPAPASLDALLALVPFEGPGHVREWREALQPYVGAAIEWELVSWGGEETTSAGGFDTPDRHLGKVGSRVRLVSPSIKGDLSDVDRAHSLVVACVAAFDAEEGTMSFLWGKSARKPGPAAGRDTLRLRGRIWGARGEGGAMTLWIENCEIAR
jgi:hypothetical protein